MTHYEELGVELSATPAEIKAAFHRVALRCHPDYFPGDKAAEAQFQRASAAYETLQDPERRAGYDRELLAGARKADEGLDAEECAQAEQAGMMLGHFLANTFRRTKVGRAVEASAKAAGVDVREVAKAEGGRLGRLAAERLNRGKHG